MGKGTGLKISDQKEQQQMSFNPLTLELIPSVQRCLTRFFTRDFAS
jgi:hypothetical protein